MNGFVLTALAVVALSGFCEALFHTVAGVTALSTSATAAQITAANSANAAALASANSALALSGGIILIKGLAIGALALHAISQRNRGKREAVTVGAGIIPSDGAFAILSQSEPEACYRRLICDLAAGAVQDDFKVLGLFDNEVEIQSPKFEFTTAAKLGKSVKSQQICELRYSCPLTGEQIQNFFY